MAQGSRLRSHIPQLETERKFTSILVLCIDQIVYLLLDLDLQSNPTVIEPMKVDTLQADIPNMGMPQGTALDQTPKPII
jgi:hypothetical protein